MNVIRLVIFDIAGTVIEDRGEVLSTFCSTLNANGIQVDETALREWKGASKRDVVRHFVEQVAESGAIAKRVDRIYNGFRSRLKRAYAENGVTPIAGAEQVFGWLKDHDMKIAATTGFDREITDTILRKLGWEQLLAINVSSSDVPAGRPAPHMIFRAMEMARVASVAEVVNVGDTPLDLQAGMNAGVKGVIGVLTGVHDAARLRRETHTHVLGSIAEIPDAFQKEFWA